MFQCLHQTHHAGRQRMLKLATRGDAAETRLPCGCCRGPPAQQMRKHRDVGEEPMCPVGLGLAEHFLEPWFAQLSQKLQRPDQERLLSWCESADDIQVIAIPANATAGGTDEDM